MGKMYLSMRYHNLFNSNTDLYRSNIESHRRIISFLSLYFMNILMNEYFSFNENKYNYFLELYTNISPINVFKMLLLQVLWMQVKRNFIIGRRSKRNGRGKPVCRCLCTCVCVVWFEESPPLQQTKVSTL